MPVRLVSIPLVTIPPRGLVATVPYGCIQVAGPRAPLAAGEEVFGRVLAAGPRVARLEAIGVGVRGRREGWALGVGVRG